MIAIRILKWLSFLVLGLVVLVAAAFAALQTPPGRDMALGLIENAASGNGRALRIEGASGAFPLNLSLDRVTLSDPDGFWLTLEDVSLSGRSLALFLLRVDLDALTVGRVHMKRRPVPASGGAGGGGPAIALPIEVRRFQIGEIVLDAPVAGQSATLSADGDLDAWVAAPGLRLRLDAARTDGQAGQAALNLAILPDPWRIDAWAEIAEDADGLIQTAFDLPRRDAYALRLSAAGALDDLAADLALTFGGAQVLTGTATLSGHGAVRQASADLTGNLAGTVPGWLDPYLGGDLIFQGQATILEDDMMVIDLARLSGPGIDADMQGQLSLGAGADALSVAATLGRAAGTEAATAADAGSPAAMPVRRADLFATAETRDGRSEITLRGGLAGLALANMSAARGSVTLQAHGDGRTLRDSDRFDATLQGELAGAVSTALDLVHWFGDRVRFAVIGGYDRASGVTVRDASAVSRALQVAFSGQASAARATGDVTVAVDSANGPVGPVEAGAGTLTAAIDYDAARGRIAADLDGRFAALDVNGPPGADLFDGDVTVAGAVRREGDDDLRLDGIAVTGGGITLSADGRLSPTRLSLALDGAVSRLAALDADLDGAVRFEGDVSGTPAAPRLVLNARGEDVTLAGRPLLEPVLDIDGGLVDNAPTGTAVFTALLQDQPVEVSVEASSDADTLRIDRLFARIADASASGDVTWPRGGAPAGGLDIDVPDLSVVGPFVLADMAGRLSGRLNFVDSDGLPGATFDGAADNLRWETVEIARAELDGQLRDLLGARLADGQGRLSGVRLGDQTIETATVTARSEGEGTDVAVSAVLSDAEISGDGLVTAGAAGVRVDLRSALVATRGIEARLTEPARLTIADGSTRIDGARFDIGGGSLDLDGSIGATLALHAEARQVPLAVAAPFLPGVEPRGVLVASVDVSGSADAPQTDWSLSLSDTSTADTRALDLPGFAVTGQGRLRGETLTLDLRTTSGDQMDLTTRGTVTLADRTALALQVNGDAALALTRPMLRDDGILLGGRAGVDLAIGGTADRPRVTGVVTPRNVSATLDQAGIRLRQINGTVRLDGQTARLDNVTGVIEPEGQVAVAGTVGYGGRTGPDLDLDVDLRQAQFQYEDLVTARLNADLTARGVPNQTLLVAGTVDVARADIRVPEGRLLGGGQQAAAQPPASGQPTGGASGAAAGGSPSGQGTAARLDVAVNAPQQVFIRGRGLDVEMGGSLQLTGPVERPSPNGAFAMRQGHLDFLGQRLVFSRGNVGFDGSYDPTLDLLAERQTDRALVAVLVGGRASRPSFDLQSNPPLPLDETLALLLFGRPVNELSTAQIAQLADGVAQLGGAPSILSRLNGLARQLGFGQQPGQPQDGQQEGAQPDQPINQLLDLGTQLFRNLQ